MWEEMGERGRCAESTLKAAFGLVMGTKPRETLNDDTGLAAIEEAIEMFVGDPLNGKRDYRRTGVSRFVDPAAPASTSWSPSSLQMATENIVTEAYAHELLYKVGNELIRRGMYETALYAYGAGTSILIHEGYATISIYKAYVSECIVTLALGDVVAASRDYGRVHLQNTGYLSSRECALEEDLVRACDGMDEDALDVARGRTGPHRAALANLDPIIRELVAGVRVSGRVVVSSGGGGGSSSSNSVGRKNKNEVAAAAPTSKKMDAGDSRRSVASSSLPPPQGGKIVERRGVEDPVARDTDAGFDEMDEIMNQMGLSDDEDDENYDGRNDDVEHVDDGEIDLR
jgi:hypothetical protein